VTDKRNKRGFNVVKTSTRYTRGGTSDVYRNRIGWWERIAMVADPTDNFYVVSRETERRPDLIAYDTYGDVSYAWLVLQFNNIVDINEELVAGKTIKLPTSTRLNTVLLANSSGGNTVTS